MEKERRLNRGLEAGAGPVTEAEYEESEDTAARIAALKEEKRQFINSVTEDEIRQILNQPSKPVEPKASEPRRGSLLDWAKSIEAAEAMSSKVSAEVNEAHAAVGATMRLADVDAKDNQALVKDFFIENRLQHMKAEANGVKPSLNERVAHNLEKAALHRAPVREEMAAEVKAAFAAFDKDGDGEISQDDFLQTMTKPKAGCPISKEKAEELFKASDKDGDGVVNFDEFISAFTQLRLRPPGWVDEGRLS